MKMPRANMGKIIGTAIGYLAGGMGGAVTGFFLGMIRDFSKDLAGSVERRRDKEAEENGFETHSQQSAYTLGVIVLAAKMARSDGRVNQKEIDAFIRVFSIPRDRIDQVGTIFNEARDTANGFEPYAARLAQVFRYNAGILEEILMGLFQIALADSPTLARQEDAFLQKIASIFGFSPQTYARIAARAGTGSAQTGNNGRAAPKKPEATEEDKAYAIFGLSPTATDADIKKTYRALIRKHHPDKLVSQGLPPELIAQATEKMKLFNAAYTTLCKARGIK